MTPPDDLVKRLRGLNNNFLITDLGLCRIYEEAAATLEAQAAEISRLTVELTNSRRKALEDAAAVADHETIGERDIWYDCAKHISIGIRILIDGETQ